MAEIIDVAVVGAGWYGRVAAHTYLRLTPKTTLLILDDSKTVGGVWSKERIYPSLYAQITHPLFEYSFYPMPNDKVSPDGFVSGLQIHEYLNNFAKDHGLLPHLRLETKVIKVERDPETSGWVLNCQNGAQYRCSKLLYATGANSSPIMPRWPQSGFGKPVIHSLEVAGYLDHIADSVKRAIVVGRSKSSYDTVFQLLKAGKKVDWITRDGPSGPFSIYAPSSFKLWNISDHIATRFATSFSPCIWNTSGPLYYFLQRTIPGRAVQKVYWTVANGMSVYGAGYWKNENMKKLRPRPYLDGVFWGSGGIGIATVPHFWETLQSDNLTVHQTEIQSMSHTDVVNLTNGKSLVTDIVISCTGFEKGYNTFDKELQQQLGLAYNPTNVHSRWNGLDETAECIVNEKLPYLRSPPYSAAAYHDHGPNRHYRRLVVPELAANGDRSLLFPGHVHSAFTPLAAELQALWGCAWMLGMHDLPSQEEMELEAATFNAWTRKRYLEQGKKHSYFIYDYLPYIDTLMKDLGLEPRRKGSFFKEWFYRYCPSDYNGIQDEFLAVKEKKKSV